MKILFILLFLIQLFETVLSDSNKNIQYYCLQKTQLTIFLDFDENNFNWYTIHVPHLVTLLNKILRDPCYKAVIYNRLERKFFELNDSEKIQYQFQNVYLKRIETDEIKLFIERFENVLATPNNRRDIVLYMKYDNNRGEQASMKLQELSNKKNIFVIVLSFIQYKLNHVDNNKISVPRFPELSWLPVHRLVLISGAKEYGDHLVCFKSVSDLLKNPDFNRFEYNEKTLVQDLKKIFPTGGFHSAIYKQTPFYFFPNIDIQARDTEAPEIIREDIDEILQLMVFMKHRLQRMNNKFYIVIFENVEFHINFWDPKLNQTIKRKLDISSLLYKQLGLNFVYYHQLKELKRPKIFVSNRAMVRRILTIGPSPIVLYECSRPLMSEQCIESLISKISSEFMNMFG